MGIIISLATMLSLAEATWIRLVVWLIIGMIIYFSYSRTHRKVQQLRQQQTAPVAGYRTAQPLIQGF